jgi:hypothetical protein
MVGGAERLVEQRVGRVLSVFAVSSDELQEWWVYIALSIIDVYTQS